MVTTGRAAPNAILCRNSSEANDITGDRLRADESGIAIADQISGYECNRGCLYAEQRSLGNPSKHGSLPVKKAGIRHKESVFAIVRDRNVGTLS